MQSTALAPAKSLEGYTGRGGNWRYRFPHYKPGMSDAEFERGRFWAFVTILDNGCWLWTGNLSDGGYGRFASLTRRQHRAHIWSYEKCVGPVPDGLELDHLCRNRACVNPLHLEPVTNVENVLRGFSPPAQNARKTHCERGHEFSGENLKIEANGYRRCLECRRITNARRYPEYHAVHQG